MLRSAKFIFLFSLASCAASTNLSKAHYNKYYDIQGFYCSAFKKIDPLSAVQRLLNGEVDCFLLNKSSIDKSYQIIDYYESNERRVPVIVNGRIGNKPGNNLVYIQGGPRGVGALSNKIINGIVRKGYNVYIPLYFGSINISNIENDITKSIDDISDIYKINEFQNSIAISNSAGAYLLGVACSIRCPDSIIMIAPLIIEPAKFYDRISLGNNNIDEHEVCLFNYETSKQVCDGQLSSARSFWGDYIDINLFDAAPKEYFRNSTIYMGSKDSRTRLEDFILESKGISESQVVIIDGSDHFNILDNDELSKLIVQKLP